MSGRRAVFLDRDGVINKMIEAYGAPRAPHRVEDLEFLPGVREATADLLRAGFLLIVVTNQPDVKRGWVSRETVDRTNEIVQRELQVHEVRACFHDRDDGCPCRKPKPGMLLDAASQWGIDLQASFMVGDRATDIEVGQAVGCKTILVGEQDAPLAAPDFRVNSLLEASRIVLKA